MMISTLLGPMTQVNASSTMVGKSISKPLKDISERMMERKCSKPVPTTTSKKLPSKASIFFQFVSGITLQVTFTFPPKKRNKLSQRVIAAAA